MRIFSRPTCINSSKRARCRWVFLAILTLLLGVIGLTANTYGSSPGLEALPSPFVSLDGSLNCSIVVASSVGHGPCGGAHTMDVMGAIMIGGKFGLNGSKGMVETTMDDYVSTYDFGTAKVALKDNSSNLVVVGGPGVNQVIWHYNNLRSASGARILPVYFDKDQSGVDYIRVASTGHSYTIERDALGRISADYGEALMFQNNGRFVLVLAGLGGSGTWASCKVVSSLEDWNLQGNAAIIKYYDSNGDGLLDKLSIVEKVSGTQYVSGSLSLAVIGAVSTPLLSKWEAIKRVTKRWRSSKSYALLFLALTVVTSQIVLSALSNSATSETYTFKDFSQPFVSADGLLNCSVVVASSVGHGPCGGAHTMDVMGAIKVAARLGLDAIGGVPSSALDDHISFYDSERVQVSFPSLESNLAVVGGPGVNQVTWYYNNLKNSTGGRVLPAYFDKDEYGVDCIRVASSGHVYRIEHDGQGKVSADYGVATLFYDTQHGLWVMIVAGLGGSGTAGASTLLTNYKSWSLFGCATVVRYADSNNDGYLDKISVAESAGFGKSVDVYWDADCLNRVDSIDWGMLAPGERANVTVYARNEGETDAILKLNAYDWSPVEASNYLKIEWDYAGNAVGPGSIVTLTISLTVDSGISGITDFSVSIEVSSG